MEDDLSKYDFTLFVPAEKENQNDSKDKNWVLTEELIENQTPDEENSNETSEEKVKKEVELDNKEVELDNKEGEKKPIATADGLIAKDNSVWNKMSPVFHRTLSDMIAHKSGLQTTTETINKNNEGETVGKVLSIQSKMQADKALLKDYGQQQQLEKQKEHQQQSMQQQHRPLYNILQIQEISKNVNQTLENIDNAFNKEKLMYLLQCEMQNCHKKIVILQSYQSALQQQMDQLLRN